MQRFPRALAAVPTLLVLLGSAACGTSSSEASSGCEPGQLKTKKAGTLTLSTGLLTRAPWVVGSSAKGRTNDPRLGKGYDAAVGYALAERLGYDDEHVTWVGSSFPDSISAGRKPFDVSINQATISDARRKDVDQTTPYWTVRDAVVTVEGRSLADVRSLRELRTIPLAVVHGTAPEGLEVVEHDDLHGVRDAVSSGQQQGMMTDFNTALQLDQEERQLVGGRMVALLPAEKGAEAYGLVLEKGSPLTACVQRALTSLRQDGTLERLEQRWLVEELRLHDLN